MASADWRWQALCRARRHNPVMDATGLETIAALDRRLTAAVRGVRILRTVALPPQALQDFVAADAAGRTRLPHSDYLRPDLAAERAELEAIIAAVPRQHPLSGYLLRACAAWLQAAHMLEAVGSAAAGMRSAALYGHPQQTIPGTALTSAQAAREFVAVATELGDGVDDPSARHELDAASVQQGLRAALDAHFGVGTVAVELDAALTAKAAAGATRIRLRDGTRFSAYDCHQLLMHEAFVHTLTAHNGMAQPVLASLARTSPHATATQEGLAVFSELVSGNMDLARLKRIGLRILGIEQALAGADFIEVYRYFRAQGQGADDACGSAARIFRGVPLSGGSAFAKDTVYLHGLLSVHTFFRWALRGRRLDLLRNLFAGKMALRDALEFEPWFASGALASPRHLPPWMARTQALAGGLAFSLFVNRIAMEAVDVNTWLQ